MPNWVNNTIKCKKEILLKYVNDKGLFDFNTIMPMPDSLNIECGSRTNVAITCYKTLKFTSNFDILDDETKKEVEAARQDIANGTYKWDLDELFNLGKQYTDNLRMYGATDWYDWCCENWGTKWNACHTDPITDDSVYFNTAWSAPEPIFEKICELNPQEEITFISDYFDGDDLEVVYRNNNGMLEFVSEEHVDFEENE